MIDPDCCKTKIYLIKYKYCAIYLCDVMIGSALQYGCDGEAFFVWKGGKT